MLRSRAFTAPGHGWLEMPLRGTLHAGGAGRSRPHPLGAEDVKALLGGPSDLDMADLLAGAVGQVGGKESGVAPPLGGAPRASRSTGPAPGLHA